MAKEIYTEIFQFYHVLNKDDTTKRAMRKVIKTRLKPRIWENLTDIEKAEFKLVTMKDYLLNYTPQRYKAEVEKNIEIELKTVLLQANKALKTHNDEIELLYKQFYDENATEEENRNSYKEFCDLLPKYAPTATVPTYDEWIEQPLRLYDYKQSEIYNYECTNGSQNYHGETVSQEKIDHYVLECIRKILEDKYRIIIDTDNIRHCLEVTQDIDLIEDEILISDIDKSSPMSEDLQIKAIQNNLNLMDAYRKLNTLDFISESKNKTQQGE